MGYHADPGGVFDSDTHRRVLGHLPIPGEEHIASFDDTETNTRLLRQTSLFHRMQPDDHTDLADGAELDEVLADLEADGYASQRKDGGWIMTKKGLEALNAPVPEGEE